MRQIANQTDNVSFILRIIHCLIVALCFIIRLSFYGLRVTAMGDTKEIDAILDGALKYPLHSISLILIYYYLVAKTFYEGFTDNDLRDEAIGDECSCKSNDRFFYQSMYWSSCGV